MNALLQVILMTAASNGRVNVPAPPIAKRVEFVHKYHGKDVVDEYHWLRDKPNPEVAAYLESENEYADSTMAHTTALQDSLYKEMLSHIKQTDENVPYRHGNYFYNSRTEEGKQYPIYERKKGSLDAKPELVLDLNEMAQGEKFMALRAYEVSDDGNLLAYSTDNTGFRQYTLRVKNLKTGEILPDKIEKTGSLAWAADNKTIFYTTEDAAKRQYRLWRHRIGESNDDLIYEEKDEMYNIGVHRTRSKAYLILDIGSHTTTENRFLDAANPTGDWKTIAPRVHEQEYYVDHRGDQFYIRVNDKGRNFRVVTTPAASPDRNNWKQLIAHRKDVMIEDLDLFANHMVVAERRKGLPQLRIHDLRAGQSHDVVFPEPAYSASGEINAEFDTPIFRYAYQSFVTPRSIFDYDMDKRDSKLLKQTEVPGGFDRANYVSERIWATAPDGVKVPISVVYRKGVKKDGKAPIFLTAYGSYGFSNPVTFNSSRLCLLDRGVVYALAHIRGGGEMGKAWHDDGRMMHKKNTFTDFIACAEHLIAKKYGSTDRLVIQGGSAGGLLMGAVTNMRPDLFKAVLSHVPFVDVINTMMDASLPLTVPEYEEWGNPNEKPAYDYMLSYSPYDQLQHKAYPTILVRTSFNDSQVMYWEPAKYAAKLRTLKTDSNPLLLKTNMAAGHGGASGRYDALHEVAFDYAFTLWQMGVN